MKKGFTLIEIIAIVIILGVIGLIGTIAISNTLRENRQKLYNTQIDNIKNSAKTWASKNLFLLPEQNGESLTLTLWYLKQEGYVQEDVTNPITDEIFSNEMLILITKNNNNYVYEVLEELAMVENSYSANAPIIILKGKATEGVQGNSSSTGVYEDLGVIAKTKSGDLINNVEIVIKKNSTVVTDIPLNESGTYYITYSATNNGFSSSITRKVIVTV